MRVQNIYQRLNRVMAEVEAIQNEGEEKTFATQEALSKALHMHMIHAGIVMIPDVCEVSQNGLRAVVKMIISFVNMDNPEDKIQIHSIGYGVDTFDSGVRKAISAAVKHACFALFSVDSSYEIKPPTIHKAQKSDTISKEQLDEVLRLAQLRPKKLQKILELLGIEDASQIPSNCYSRVLAAFTMYETR